MDSQQKQAYDLIRHRLLTGHYRPDMRLSRRSLAADLGVSAPTVQHVLGQLAKEGLVQVRPQSGSYPRVLSDRETAELNALRLQLEPYAARLAASRIDAALLQQVERSCTQYEALAEAGTSLENPLSMLMAEVYEAEQLFHRSIWLASGNGMLVQMLDRMQLLACVAMTAHRRAETFKTSLAITAAEHRRVCRALATGNGAEAAAAMRDHLESKSTRDLLDAAAKHEDRTR